MIVKCVVCKQDFESGKFIHRKCGCTTVRRIGKPRVPHKHFNVYINNKRTRFQDILWQICDLNNLGEFNRKRHKPFIEMLYN